MAYFPRVGVEFSSSANVRFLAAPLKHIRPAHRVRYSDGTPAGRFSTPGPTIDFTIVCRLAAVDLAVLTGFFSTYGVVTPFTVDHPQLGEGNCLLKQTEHELKPIIAGDPVWYLVEVPVEGIF